MDEELNSLFESAVLSSSDRDEVLSKKQCAMEELQDLDSKISQLKKQRTLAARKLQYCSATLAPIRALPADILREIFQHCLPAKHLPLMSNKDAPLLLRRVCKYWKETVDETPSLWNRLHIAIPSRRGPDIDFFQQAVTTWFSKSGSLPISFSFGQFNSFQASTAHIGMDNTWVHTFDHMGHTVPELSQDKPTPFRVILSALLPLAHRWEGIRMSRGAMHEVFATLTPSQIPWLKEVSISTASRHSLDSMKNLICAPTIQQLRLPYRSGLHWPEINWSNLKTLDIVCTSDESLHYLKLCPNLEVFIVSFENTEHMGGLGALGMMGQVHVNVQAGPMQMAFPQPHAAAPAPGPIPAAAPAPAPAPGPGPGPLPAAAPAPAGQAAGTAPAGGMPGLAATWLQQLQPLFAGGPMPEPEQEDVNVEPLRLEKLHTLRLNGNPKKNFLQSLDLPALNRLSHFTHMDIYGILGNENSPIAFDLMDLMPLQPLSDLEVVDFTMEKSIQKPVLQWLSDHPTLHTVGFHDFYSPSAENVRDSMPPELQNMQMQMPQVRAKPGVDSDLLKSLSGDATDAEGQPTVLLPQLTELKVWQCGRIPAASLIACLRSRFNPPAESEIVPLKRCLVQFAVKLAKDELVLLRAFADEMNSEGFTPKPVRFQFPEERKKGYGYTPIAGLLKDPYGVEGYQYAD